MRFKRYVIVESAIREIESVCTTVNGIKFANFPFYN